MIYSEIKQLAIDYSDRTDISNNIDGFMRIVEARINKRLRIREQYSRATIQQIADQLFYGLPADFSDLRDIQTENGTLEYYSPKQMNEAIKQNIPDSGQAYTIIANQLQIFPVIDRLEMEVVYSAKLPKLTESAPTNWLSLSAPDVYVFGILVEISAFIKDGASGGLWEQRFQEELSVLDRKDAKDRWSGTPLAIKPA